MSYRIIVLLMALLLPISAKSTAHSIVNCEPCDSLVPIRDTLSTMYNGCPFTIIYNYYNAPCNGSWEVEIIKINFNSCINSQDTKKLIASLLVSIANNETNGFPPIINGSTERIRLVTPACWENISPPEGNGHTSLLPCEQNYWCSYYIFNKTLNCTFTNFLYIPQPVTVQQCISQQCFFNCHSNVFEIN
ncbi:MAG: hypothetical protein ACK6DA_00570 [Candidatus Kapaibacterium sp.]